MPEQINNRVFDNEQWLFENIDGIDAAVFSGTASMTWPSGRSFGNTWLGGNEDWLSVTVWMKKPQKNK